MLSDSFLFCLLLPVILLPKLKIKALFLSKKLGVQIYIRDELSERAVIRLDVGENLILE
jgi:hypothetical protein